MSKNKANSYNYVDKFDNYKILLEILKKGKLNRRTFHEYNQGDVIDNAHLTAVKLNSFLNFINIGKNYKILDIGCGLGMITKEISKINSIKNTYGCEPSIYASKFIKLYYPKLKVINAGIDEIGEKFFNFFDILYLREVSPFRRGNLIVHKKLIKKMKKILRKNGIIVFEQILNKGKIDIFSNLKELNVNYKIYPSTPYFLLRNKILRNFILNNYGIFNSILNMLDHVFFHYLKKKTYYIVIKI